MEIDRREKSVEQSTNAILNPSARSENTFFVNCPVLAVYIVYNMSIVGFHTKPRNIGLK